MLSTSNYYTVLLKRKAVLFSPTTGFMDAQRFLSLGSGPFEALKSYHQCLAYSQHENEIKNKAGASHKYWTKEVNAEQKINSFIRLFVESVGQNFMLVLIWLISVFTNFRFFGSCHKVLIKHSDVDLRNIQATQCKTSKKKSGFGYFFHHFLQTQ